MDLGYLVCSSLRCDTEHFVHDSDGIDAEIVAKSINDPSHHHPGAVESTDSEFSSLSEQQQAAFSAVSNASSFSVDASSNSTRTRNSLQRKLQAGHISPSSLALQRRPPEPSFYLKQQTLSTDISTASGDNSTVADSSFSSLSNTRNNYSMGIASNSNPSQPDSRGLESGVSNVFVSTIKSESVTTDGKENEKKTSLSVEGATVASLEQFYLDPPPLRSKGWSDPSAEDYNVRSKMYLATRIKQPSEKSAFRLLTVDLVNTKTPIYTGMCAHPGERVQLALGRERKTGVRELPEFIFAVNLCIPAQTIYHAVFYYEIDKATMQEIKNSETPFGRNMNKFIFGDSDEYRNNTFKLIPRIVKGNYIVRKGVGTKPVILGKGIKQYYVRGGASGNNDLRYFEIIVDIASDAIAKRITKMCLGYIKTIVVDMMFALEGHDEATLPERIFGGATIKNLNFKMMDGKRTVR
mmetsp:Transcript_1334/g.3397  ORF Transcript_1334/g.3397 Transcript_1334/m.3397 type:complete len:465 (+) Transcript_1334:176-1570(+)|eukprot:CAMPEP_0172362626 /NCGR_PEP_ID=MMETSP1060-20121228/6203_1 /TAXON_ID=37318 /ORGANISM="Pseudo-nitzschia pungens, Strain cf. cingulata" /LENGTH=464 /DNA_ID=CAMNT_0013085181 /DNA_START=173 /DNA_END=1567 /DNA_ORIENTATION=-